MEKINLEYRSISDEAIENIKARKYDITYPEFGDDLIKNTDKKIKNTGKKLIAIYALSYCAGFIIGFFITKSINEKINNA